MTLIDPVEARPFLPGTTGWTAADLDDPEVEHHWVRGAYEIVDGVLTTMPPAYFVGGSALFQLMHRVTNHAGEQAGRFAVELEIIVDDVRVARADAAFLTREDRARQAAAAQLAGRKDPNRTRILIPSTLVIESVSPGHERHDHQTKRRWYAEFGIPHYWLLNAFQKSFELLVLDGGDYRSEATGRGEDELRPSLFPGLVLRLAELWTAD